MGCPARGAQPAHEADRLRQRLMGKTLASVFPSGSVDWTELMRSTGPHAPNVGYVEYERSELFARNRHYVDYGEVKRSRIPHNGHSLCSLFPEPAVSYGRGRRALSPGPAEGIRSAGLRPLDVKANRGFTISEHGDRQIDLVTLIL